MPKLLYRRRTPLLTGVREERSKKYRVRRADAWIDPYPNVQGTLPEKMVYAELMRRKIPFNYQTWFRANLPAYGFDNWYRPDFIIPDAKLIIEVQGFYFHSTPEAIENDVFKGLVYEKMGYRVLTYGTSTGWWDFDILSKLQLLFAREPALMKLQGRGGRILTGKEEERDDSAGIKKANQARTDYGAREAVYSVRKAKTRSLYSYGV